MGKQTCRTMRKSDNLKYNGFCIVKSYFVKFNDEANKNSKTLRNAHTFSGCRTTIVVFSGQVPLAE